MNKLKRILSLSFLTIMLGVPIATLAAYYQEVQAASLAPTLKIRYLDETGGDDGTGVYHDDAYAAGGKLNEESSTTNDCIKVQFRDKGVKDPYSGKIVKLTDQQYKTLAASLKQLPTADGSNGVEKETGSDVRYIVWYQFDKQRDSNNFWRTEGYYVGPAEINVSDTTSDTISTTAPGFYLERTGLCEIPYIGQNGQTWVLTIFAVRYDYFHNMYEDLSAKVQNAFGKEGGRTVLYLQPKIGIYKNKVHVNDCYNLQSWINTMNWSNSSTFKDHYNQKVLLNLTNKGRLFVHYVREGTLNTSETKDGQTIDYPYGKPVVDESNVLDAGDKVYSIYNYTPGNDAANKANGISVAAPSTFPVKGGPRDVDTQERVDIFKKRIKVESVNDEGEPENIYWHVTGVRLIFLKEDGTNHQQFKIKFSYDKDGEIDFSKVTVVNDARDQSLSENNPKYVAGQVITYQQFLDELRESRLETASVGDTIVVFEYKKSKKANDEDEDRDFGGKDKFTIDYQYQTFDSAGNEVWKTFATEEATVPDNRIWEKQFNKVAEQPYQYYGIYSVHATDNDTGKRLLLLDNNYQPTSSTETKATSFYDTDAWKNAND